MVQEALSLRGQGAIFFFFLPGGSGAGGIISWGGRVQNHFSDLNFFFNFEFKNTSNLIFPGFKVPSERFLFKDFKTGLTFCHMWFFNFQNLVRSCQPLGGTPCICRSCKICKTTEKIWLYIKHFIKQKIELSLSVSFPISLCTPLL